MQNCDQLDDYLCGWLDPAGMAEFEQHLDGCADCQQSLELQQRIDGNMAAYRESVATPSDLAPVLVERQRDGAEPERNPVSLRNRVSATGWLRLASVLVAAAVLMGIGVSLYRLRTSDTEIAPESAPVASETPDNAPVVAVTAVEATADADELTRPPVSMRPGPGTIAVQVPTRSSRVSVFRVYNSIGNPPTPSGLPD